MTVIVTSRIRFPVLSIVETECFAVVFTYRFFTVAAPTTQTYPPPPTRPKKGKERKENSGIRRKTYIYYAVYEAIENIIVGSEMVHI